jgi:hypothetical protein
MNDEILIKIRDILLDHKGNENYISSSQIADMVGVKAGKSNITIRGLIKDTIYQYGLPVAGGSKGYFLIMTDEELKAYMNNLNSRKQEIDDRLKRIIFFYGRYHTEVDPQFIFDEDENYNYDEELD